MLDKYNRNIDYLRISITDKCNYRCNYCMPITGVKYIEHDEILRTEEIICLAEIFGELGIKKIKITGGEPLVRKGVIDLIKGISNVREITDITMTSNGYYLDKLALELKNSGLSCMNVSIDTLDNDKYKKICNVDGLSEVLKGIDTAKSIGLDIKINATLGKHTDSKDIIELLEYGREKNLIIRFIEMMPIGLGSIININGEFVKEVAEEKFGKIREISLKTNGPATYYETDEGVKFGLIEAVHNKFCSSCNRLRLTADGKIKPCLAYDRTVDIKNDLRLGVSRRKIKEKLAEILYEKPISHNFEKDKASTFMNGIGG